MPEVFVGCGSNIDPEPNLRWAVSALAERFGGLQCSSVYRSPAYGFSGPDFLNLVVGFRTGMSADDVESVLSALENVRGRGREGRSGSRTLDLDLLIYGARIDPRRRLPRSDVLRYSFVLAPLAEIAPGLRHPVTGITAAGSWSAAREGHPQLLRLGPLAPA